MYILNDKAKDLLSYYKIKLVAQAIGINATTLSDMIKKDRSCIKLTAYCLTKFLNPEAEIQDYFTRKEC